MRRFMDDVNHDDKFSFLFLNLDKFLKNSTPGNIAYIWQIDRVQIDATSLKESKIIF